MDDQGNPTGEYEIASIDLTDIDDETGNFPEGAKAEIKDNLITITGSNEFEMIIDVGNVDPANLDLSNMEIDATGIGAMRLQIGANEGQVLAMEIANVSLQNMGIENIDVSTCEGAEDAITRLEGAIDFVSGIRSELGAYQNRMESTINSLDITSENMTAAYSRIMDVDMAEEMTEYTTTQVITQAGTSMLAQANERPSQVLQLLQ